MGSRKMLPIDKGNQIYPDITTSKLLLPYV